MNGFDAELQAIFENNRCDFGQRMTTVEAAVTATLHGTLGEELRAAAQSDAHKLAGSLGTFGRPDGSALARELELQFARTPGSEAVDDAHLTAVVGALRLALDSDPGDPPARGTIGSGAPEFCARVPARILVVDDDPPVRQTLVQILSGAGYEVRGVGSAQEARHALARETVDLLLTDVRMPGETGMDLVRFALCEHPGTATLLISAIDDPAIAQVAIEFGAYGYLSKPVRRTEVLIAAMNALRRRDGEARERATREDLLAAAATERHVLQAEAIRRWAQSAEYRDPGIARHLEMVGRTCAVLGRAFGLRSEEIGLASVLHDVGKLAISDSILLKPGPLTVQERQAIETHAQIGWEMLAGSDSTLLDLAAVIARTHHEKFDGSGYPFGLRGEEIPIEGRIAAVADVFDALTADRAYRRAWSTSATVEWMLGERGKHFDPDVLDVFLSSLSL